MSLYHCIEVLLELKGVRVTNIDNRLTKTLINIELPITEHHCPMCDTPTTHVHDYRSQVIKDIPIHQKLTLLVYRRRRYVCKACGKRFSESNDFIAKYQHKTSRLNLFILSKLKNLISMATISKEFHVSPPTIARIMDTVNKQKPRKLPKVLSIDEFKGDFGYGKYQCILTNPDSREVLDITPTRSEAHLLAYFRPYSMEERKSVEYIVIDMWRPYYSCMKRIFPDAKIIIDKFHFVRQVNWSLENTRKRVQKELVTKDRLHFKRSRKLLNMRYSKVNIHQYWKLEKIFSVSPEMKIAHQLKEDFYTVMSSENSHEAAVLIDKWIESAKRSNIKEFDASIRAFTNWREPILNSFDVPYTNGYTEGFNNKIKVLKRVSFGLSNFERTRNRILHLT